jgi:hypothetical protein
MFVKLYDFLENEETAYITRWTAEDPTYWAYIYPFPPESVVVANLQDFFAMFPESVISNVCDDHGIEFSTVTALLEKCELDAKPVWKMIQKEAQEALKYWEMRQTTPGEDFRSTHPAD